VGRFIYAVKDIFSPDPRNGCLGQHNCEGFLIDSYQRGYKWDSEQNNWESPTPVNTLFRDIFDAIQKNRDSQYYLQFINVKEQTVGDRQRYLEVIDGQQRLTTLSILSAAFKHKFGDDKDFADKSIRYRCRAENERLLDSLHDAQEIFRPNSDQEENDQTNWFFKKAYNALCSMIDQLEERKCDPKDFYKYLTENVLIIVNVVRETIRSEDVFNNLNGHRVFLTNVDLIKGLLLCKAVRNEAMPYRELLERRTLYGRQWDEMTRWFNTPDVGAFFFESTKRANYDFLLLAMAAHYNLDDITVERFYTAAQEEFQPDVKRYQLFNLLYSKIRNAADAMLMFNRLYDLYWHLHDIYDDIPRHNEVGFILFPKCDYQRILTLKKIVRNTNRPNIDLVADLFGDSLARGEGEFIQNYPYSYRINPQCLRRDLMFINCFRIEDGNFTANSSCKFPFHLVDHGNPDNHGKMNSLEHIFPQNPLTDPERKSEKEPGDCFYEYTTVKCAEQIADLAKFFSASPEACDMVREYEKALSLNTIQDFYNKITMQKKAHVDEIRRALHRFYAGLTQNHKEIFDQKYKNGYSYLDSIGNVVLLLGGENTTVSNYNFAHKRELLREMINNGNPIPAHTLDAFSKIGGDVNHMECWQLVDVTNNEKYTLRKVFQLRQALNNALASQG